MNTMLHSRFDQIVPAATRNLTVIVVGAGMVGSWTALALARMVKEVHVWDFDTVGPENIGVQAYGDLHVGMNKADAVAMIGYGLPIVPYAHRFDKDVLSVPGADILVSSPDSMSARAEAARWAYDGADIEKLIDTRVIGELACIETVTHCIGCDGTFSGTCDADNHKGQTMLRDYMDTLPTDDQVSDAPCGAKGTAFASMWVASQVCSIVNRIGRGMPLPPKMVWHVGLNQEVTNDQGKEAPGN